MNNIKPFLGNSQRKAWAKPELSVLNIKKDTFGGSDKWSEGHPNKPPKP